MRAGGPSGNPLSHGPLVLNNGPCLWETQDKGGLAVPGVFSKLDGLYVSALQVGYNLSVTLQSPLMAGHLSP